MVCSPAPPTRRVYVGADRDFGLGAQLYAVFGDGGDDRGLDDFRVDAHLHGLKHVAAGKVYGCGALKFERDVGPLRGDQGIDDTVHVAAGKDSALPGC